MGGGVPKQPLRHLCMEEALTMYIYPDDPRGPKRCLEHSDIEVQGCQKVLSIGGGDEENLCGVMKLKNSIVANSRESGSMLSEEYLEF